jgi:oligoendopeptidase F
MQSAAHLTDQCTRLDAELRHALVASSEVIACMPDALLAGYLSRHAEAEVRAHSSSFLSLFWRAVSYNHLLCCQSAMHLFDRSFCRHTLPPSQERMLAALVPSGLAAFGTLYNSVVSSLKVVVRGAASQPLSISAANQQLRTTRSREQRLQIYDAIEQAWAQHETVCAHALNSIAQWRLTVNRYQLCAVVSNSKTAKMI